MVPTVRLHGEEIDMLFLQRDTYRGIEVPTKAIQSFLMHVEQRTNLNKPVNTRCTIIITVIHVMCTFHMLFG